MIRPVSEALSSPALHPERPESGGTKETQPTSRHDLAEWGPSLNPGLPWLIHQRSSPSQWGFYCHFSPALLKSPWTQKEWLSYFGDKRSWGDVICVSVWLQLEGPNLLSARPLTIIKPCDGVSLLTLQSIRSRQDSLCNFHFTYGAIQTDPLTGLKSYK